ncbi:MAG TPA: dienelactone hydrolase family protein [Xanthomonadales bacterium]|nr:dienelactone hydrolase family protein [Xanthomonadales bacterium]
MPAFATPTNRDRVIAADIPLEDGRELHGDWVIPVDAAGTVLFAHGSGSSRRSPRNQFVARSLQAFGLGTLLFDLLTPDEEEADRLTGHLRFDVHLLARRLLAATAWFRGHSIGARQRFGYFGASTGAAAALIAAAELGDQVDAVVSRGGRPDLAGRALAQVTAPTLLIVGGRDEGVIELNELAYAKLGCTKELQIVPGATHLFEEPGALAQVGMLAATWFERHLGILSAVDASGRSAERTAPILGRRQ